MMQKAVCLESALRVKSQVRVRKFFLCHCDFVWFSLRQVPHPTGKKKINLTLSFFFIESSYKHLFQNTTFCIWILYFHLCPSFTWKVSHGKSHLVDVIWVPQRESWCSLSLACRTVHPFVISHDKGYLHLGEASFKLAETSSKQAMFCIWMIIMVFRLLDHHWRIKITKCWL